MLRRELVISNKTGLHARPAAMFVQKANKFTSSILIEKDGKEINAKSIVSVLAAGIGSGAKVTLVIDGEDEKAAEKDLVQLVEDNFGE